MPGADSSPTARCSSSMATGSRSAGGLKVRTPNRQIRSLALPVPNHPPRLVAIPVVQGQRPCRWVELDIRPRPSRAAWWRCGRNLGLSSPTRRLVTVARWLDPRAQSTRFEIWCFTSGRTEDQPSAAVEGSSKCRSGTSPDPVESGNDTTPSGMCDDCCYWTLRRFNGCRANRSIGESSGSTSNNSPASDLRGATYPAGGRYPQSARRRVDSQVVASHAGDNASNPKGRIHVQPGIARQRRT
jgi:hypothetical protein